ncbi:MAG: MFS transporter [Bacteroidales bacterium]|nr:MFS transporter [Bacteroidales bacterium]NCU35734.1 MFS transporter [Candidatus Falkowbacteria bacterium]MDD3527674.1 MFS transporter [Bacteroidales bacterium]MDD4177029.1 MFS transporter [Bacteroidales bacterium]MDD4741850.1 MFS transporter [Bacteroidales bacterium]
MLPFQQRLSNFFYVVLGLPATAMGFGLSIQIAVLSWILRTQYGLEMHEIGIVWAAGPIAGIIGQPIVGLISDGTWFWGGRRRPFIFIGGILAALSILALPHIGLISATLGIGSIVAVATTVALTLDLSINISFNPTRAIIADVTPDGEPRTKGYTWMQAISNFFGAGAYLIAALVGNMELIYIGAGVVFLFSVVPMFFITEPRDLISVEDKDVEPTRTDWKQLFRIYFAHGFSWLGIQTMFIYSIAFFEQRFNTTDEVYLGAMIGWSFFILNAVGAIFPIVLLEPLSRRIGKVKTQVLSVASMAIGYFLIVLVVRDTITMYLIFVLLSLGWAAVVSLPFAIMSEKVNKVRMGFFMGIFNLSVVLPQLVASLVLGFFIQSAADKTIIYLISGISLAISAVLWLLVKEKSAHEDITIDEF